MPDDPVLAQHIHGLLEASREHAAANNIPEAVRLSVELAHLAPNLPDAHQLMGQLAMKTNAPEIATGSFGRALALRPGSETAHLELGQALLAAGRATDALAVLEKGQSLNAKNGHLLRELAQAQLALGDTKAALQSFRRALKLLPKDLYAAHMATALSEAGTTNVDYVTTLFDNYAGHFEEHLTTTLGYKVPEALAEMIARLERPTDPVLDIGCGTGLVGAALAAAGQIDGIDLSPRMVEKTRERGIYRHLAAGDAATVLREDGDFSGPYRLIVAADVFIYVGDVDVLFGAMNTVIAAGGLVAFSVETAVDDEIEIRASGRFAHAPGYIARLAEKHGFAIIALVEHDIRLDAGHPVAGALYVLEAA